MAQRLSKLRLKRRKEARTSEFIELSLNRDFCFSVEEILGSRTSSVECFQVILNSLRRAFMKRPARRITRSMGPEFLERAAREKANAFLRDKIDDLNRIATSSGTASDPDRQVSKEREVLLHEILCLAELHLLHAFPRPLSETKVVDRVRELYFVSNPVRTKKFLDDVVCDEYIDDLPLFLAQMYDQLDMPMPEDLAEYRPYESARDVEGPVKQPEKNRLAEKLEELYALSKGKREPKVEIKLEEDATDRPQSSRPHPPPITSRPIKVEGEDRQPDRRYLANVEETPEVKAAQRVEPTSPYESIEIVDEIVEQTPIAKIRRGTQKETAKHAKLLTEEEQKRKALPSLSTIKRAASRHRLKGGNDPPKEKRSGRVAKRRLIL